MHVSCSPGSCKISRGKSEVRPTGIRGAIFDGLSVGAISWRGQGPLAPAPKSATDVCVQKFLSGLVYFMIAFLLHSRLCPTLLDFYHDRLWLTIIGKIQFCWVFFFVFHPLKFAVNFCALPPPCLFLFFTP